MGCASSKNEKNEAILLCKERKELIKQAIDSRYSLASAHLSYVQSLRSLGSALRRYAEAEILIESSLSTSATEIDKTPSHSSYLSPSPSHTIEAASSPLDNEIPFSSPLSTLSYMRSSGTGAMTVTLNSPISQFIDDDSLTFPPPPPLPPDADSSWDYFDPIGSSNRFVSKNGYGRNVSTPVEFRHFDEECETKREKDTLNMINSKKNENERTTHEPLGSLVLTNMGKERLTIVTHTHSLVDDVYGKMPQMTQKLEPKEVILQKSESGTIITSEFGSKCFTSEMVDTEQGLCPEREDPSEFITHRAKDFLSSIKDIEHRFFRASESGKEVLRMLEANKIGISCSENKEPYKHMTRIMTWNRSFSIKSSSSRNPLTSISKDDVDDSSSDFIEDFCMISGSHSCTLDRLLAWERKLYDEVKAGEFIRRKYDRKCNHLRHQFAKDVKLQVVDKTRALVKDLYSRINVGIRAVDSISKQIEKLRDEELHPQLVELIQGFIRMWKVMLECHHSQYITISLAYHSKTPTNVPQSEFYKQVLDQLHNEINCFKTSFTDWIRAHKSYVESLNSWLQKGVLPTQDRFRGRKIPFSPRRALAPPIFLLCRDWLNKIDELPSIELSESLNNLIPDLQETEQLKKRMLEDEDGSKEIDANTAEKSDHISRLSSLQTNLTRTFDCMTKFAEASLKIYEDIRQGNEKLSGLYGKRND